MTASSTAAASDTDPTTPRAAPGRIEAEGDVAVARRPRCRIAKQHQARVRESAAVAALLATRGVPPQGMSAEPAERVGRAFHATGGTARAP
ncbi:hypothetical protein [Nonomuraea sp. NPDC050540]|uniref:hypothetical protein n=1 Tax=Nonomuraea sp. NPDC050540 TaxID=3364367 RepID=UPI00378AF257